ncbi:MAG TPA: hypothetical protein VEL31_01320, partial [Ktedonobacteraceae bacterium]|nr:hypothetical protein [Ktedonobacteraceae bacterium]
LPMIVASSRLCQGQACSSPVGVGLAPTRGPVHAPGALFWVRGWAQGRPLRVHLNSPMSGDRTCSR